MAAIPRWQHAPGGALSSTPLPTSYDGQCSPGHHSEEDEEPVFGRRTMKANSRQYVEQFRAEPSAAIGGHSASNGLGLGHSRAAYAAGAHPAPYPTPDASGKENSLRVTGKAAAPPRSPRYGSSLGAEAAPGPLGPPPPGFAAATTFAAGGGRAPEPAHQLRPTGKWAISEDQMHQPWGTVLRSLAQPR